MSDESKRSYNNNLKGPSRHGVPVLKARGLSKSFSGKLVVNNADLEVWPGEVVALVGENGAGYDKFFVM